MKRTKALLFVSLMLALSLLVLFGSTALASDRAGQAQYEVELPDTTSISIDYSAITTVIANYFSYYYRSIEQLAVAPELAAYVADTDDTHLYLRALQYGISWRKALNTGIADSNVKRIAIKYAKQNASGLITVGAYVNVGFRYLDDESQTMTGLGEGGTLGSRQ